MADKSIGALWARKTRAGADYFTGVIDVPGGKMQIVAFFNDHKTKPNQPDFNILKSEPRPADSMGNENPQPKRKDEEAIEYPSEDIDPNDIPF